jgi:DNA topoisomerase-1
MKSVVVVESPAKAKTINKYLGKDYTVLASYGHIRDLPSKNGSVNPDNDFSMIWETEPKSQRHINEIATALKSADQLLLATDPDREGEAISWHVQQVLSEKGILKNKDVKRIVFHEITKNAIQQAILSPRDINQSLVEAYLARRALDYLVGFTLSPVLWRKLPGSKSAGRVQSVALRLIVERENEIEAFKTQEYWSVTVDCKTEDDKPFSARLTYLNGKKLEKLDLTTELMAQAACDAIATQNFYIGPIEKKQVRRNPAAPFITSTLQQEASRKLGFSANRTMQLAQRLYEGIDIGGETTGLITYMRTDSVNMSKEAVEEAREFITSSFGKDYIPQTPRHYKNKAKNAQEAHEAIRPTVLSRRPQDVAPYLDEAQLKLYELIWKRAIASQMENALFDQVSVDILSEDKKIMLRATGSTLTFDGFLKLYQEGKDDSEGDEDQDRLLPKMVTGATVTKEKIIPNQHFTQPPPRYSEASLVKKLEELGIGRPSTYASIINVLQERNYVRIEKKQFIPEDRGRLVTSFLVNFFKKYVEYDFTAHLEEELDEISNGDLAWKQVLTQFWDAFSNTIKSTESLKISDVLDCLEKDLSFYLFHGQAPEERTCPTCHTGKISLKLSRYGAFLGCSNYPDCRYTRALSTDGTEGPTIQQDEPKVLGNDPETQEQITLRKGPYGYYIQWGVEKMINSSSEDKPKKGKKKETVVKPKRVSLPPSLSPDDVDLEQALALKELPKEIGIHPETGTKLIVNIGRFGPYIKHGDQFISIPKTDDFLTITLERALELIAAKAARPPKAKYVRTTSKSTTTRDKKK